MTDQLAVDVDQADPAVEAERFVLGALLIEIDRNPGADDLVGTDFYLPRHAVIFKAIREGLAAGDPVDPIAVGDRLRETGDLQRCGGLPYLHQCASVALGSAGTVAYHSGIVRAAAARRARERLVAQLGQIVASDDQWVKRGPDLLEQLAGQRVALTTESDDEALDWSTFLAQDLAAADWAAGQLIENGQQAALVGSGKVGKSLFSLDWAVHLAAGLPFLGDQARPPANVLYVDQENARDEIQHRLHSLGHGPDRLGRLTYLSYPRIGPLDTREGAAALLARVDRYQPRWVFLDTVSRFISGKENESDTWLALYSHTLQQLKARGIGCVRLDHFGKDEGRGARGNSAKTQDVDAVWELTGSGKDLRLRRTHTRAGIGDDDVWLLRHGAPRQPASTWHERVNAPALEEGPGWILAQQISARLDAAGVERSAGRDRLKEAGKPLGIKVSNEVWSEVARLRKAGGGSPDALL
ncbi:AAA family ATPase [Micromonospora sp. NPDC051227]|uniref:AAA family ATPase n=1 Tax=Micromonospora sp. NPDC051227 TaxID=3364285 RepID=UPI00379679AE